MRGNSWALRHPPPPAYGLPLVVLVYFFFIEAGGRRSALAGGSWRAGGVSVGQGCQVEVYREKRNTVRALRKPFLFRNSSFGPLVH